MSNPLQLDAAAVVRQRLRNQRLAPSMAHSPAEIVGWLGAVQAQDYPAAKWGIGLRARGITDATVERAFNDGAILRTHFLRPTWHFVTPADIRWMLALSGHRVHAANGHPYRRLGLDRATLKRSRTVLERALRGGKHLTRLELGSALHDAGIAADGQRLAYIVMHAELDRVICSGARRGKQFTYALFEERVPAGPALKRDEALARLTQRYFTSRGPATPHDFAWWSGLTVGDARRGIEMVQPALEQNVIDGRTYWFDPVTTVPLRVEQSAYLLPNYDEFGIAYRNRDIVPSVPRPQRIANGAEFAHLLFINGSLVGRWRIRLGPRAGLVEAQPFQRLTASERRALEAAVTRYSKFLEVPLSLSIV